ncbi:hypothetical protein PIB30_075258 [Stylosanthes scabra]|uniref:Secreted protein n=1 Tax=Stylosanthes scabra TaxID=79078 RepID=A0ABU6ZNT5_9FABA|nr:hypothetical protein [Stylosanthes scabra]
MALLYDLLYLLAPAKLLFLPLGRMAVYEGCASAYVLVLLVGDPRCAGLVLPPLILPPLQETELYTAGLVVCTATFSSLDGSSTCFNASFIGI